jgi:hypothetical protein
VRGDRAFDHRRIVTVSAQHPGRIGRVRGADHLEQAGGLFLAVDHPARVEDLVAAMFGIRLREHHQFGIGGIALFRAEFFRQIGHLVGRQGEAQLAIGALERRQALAEQRNAAQPGRRVHGKQVVRQHVPVEQGLGHPVVQQRRKDRDLLSRERLRRNQAESDQAFNAPHDLEPATVDDIGGLARPGRDGADARDHQQRLAGKRRPRLVSQQATQRLLLAGRQFTGYGQAVLMSGHDPADPRHAGANRGEQLVELKRRQCAGTRPHQHGARYGQVARWNAAADLSLVQVAGRCRRIDRRGELADVAGFCGADLADALLFDDVDAQDGMDGQIAAPDAGKLAADALFGGIDDDRAALAEHQPLDLDETEQCALGHIPGVDLVDLALAEEDNFVETSR